MSTWLPGLFNFCSGIAVELFVLGSRMLYVLLVNDAHNGGFLKENPVKLRQRDVQQQLGLSLPLQANENGFGPGPLSWTPHPGPPRMGWGGGCPPTADVQAPKLSGRWG